MGEYGRVELVDYGGMSAVGRSVRQFTEIYDRGFWSAGSRTAEPSYDWFSFAVLWVHALDGKRLMQLTRTLLPQNRNPREIMKLVRSNPDLQPLEGWMGKALAGNFNNTAEVNAQWRESVREAQKKATAAADRIPSWMTGLLAASAILVSMIMILWWVS